MITFLIHLNYFIQNASLRGLRKLLFRTHNPDKVEKILIWRGGSLGDNICALPAFATIRHHFPEAKIEILTNSRGAHLVSLEQLIAPGIVNHVHNAFGLSRSQRRHLLNTLRVEAYDLFIEIPENLATWQVEARNMIIAKFLRIPSGFGWQVAAIRMFRKHQASIFTFDRETVRLLKILETHGLSPQIKDYPLGVSDRDRNRIRTDLDRLGISKQSRNIAFVVGAKRVTNRWPIAYFKLVAEYLVAKKITIFIIGGKEDNLLAKQLLFHPRIYNFCGELSPLESGALLEHCELCLTNDTGPMHLSYAVKTPVVALFSARDYPNKWFPPDTGENKVFRRYDMPCSPCFLETCPYENKCLEIAPQEIIQELQNRGY